MTDVSPSRFFTLFLGIVVLAFWFSAYSISASAQTGSQGQNGVYYADQTCCKGTSAFVDASTFVFLNSDFCTVLYTILHAPTYSVTVIDARGLSSSNTNMTCASGTPWNQGGISANVPSTILLPAGTITIPQTWVLPSKTHLIGQGDNIGAGTILKANTSFSSPMIQFGSVTGASEISVENLVLDGQGQTITGILNQYAGDYTYVDHVGLYKILGTGLSISATDSGPYSNINFDTVVTGLLNTKCLSISGTSGTRGVHGLTCTSENNNANVAVVLDASNNSIEDARISGFGDGVRVGYGGDAKSNVLINILGDTMKHAIGPPIYTVHIANQGYAVSDLTVIGAGNSAISGTYTIADDLTGIQLTDNTVGMYALGKSRNGGYSLFTTSPHAPSWASGTVQPTGTCTQGSIYSCTGSATSCGSKALWGCPVTSSGAWVPIS